MQTLRYGRRILIAALFAVAIIGLIGTWFIQTTPASAVGVPPLIHQPTATPEPTTVKPTPTPQQPDPRLPTTLCSKNPNHQDCDRQDPVAQGCVSDATTHGTANIYDSGVLVGRVDRRFSKRCQSYWVRTFNYTQKGNIIAEFIGLSFVPGAQSYLFADEGDALEEYTNMVYDPLPAAPPEVRGTLSLSTLVVEGTHLRQTNFRNDSATIR